MVGLLPLVEKVTVTSNDNFFFLLFEADLSAFELNVMNLAKTNVRTYLA